MKIDNLDSYILQEEENLSDINSKGYVLKHKKSGARIVLIENDDNNKTFSIGFRTPPSNDTGVAHIMEHSVLCGSKKFPVKDPFMELAKGSLNTFLNAMTYPDKTVFPVSSTNDKDFHNLMDVYLDAVFHPNIYEREEIFCQEGFTYSLQSKEDELQYNGVVYNEMKGAFSSPDDVLDRVITQSLFPDNCYGVESGGNPDFIPELTYEEFLNFHKKYYHPSNSYIYIYGDMDMNETLHWLDEAYLSEFSNDVVDSEIKYQKPFEKMNVVREEYSVSESEPLKDNTFLSYNFVIGDILQQELYLAFQVLEYALVSMPGAPIKKALLEKGIGKDITGRYNNYILQPYFTFTAKNANESDQEMFVQTVNQTLEKIVQDGIDKKSLLAALNNYEFQYRESDFGSYPKGLMYSFEVFDSWLYEDTHPFRHLKQNDLFKKLREKLNTDYYEKLIQKYFIENKHSSLVIVVPVAGLTTKKDEALRQKLSKQKEKMSEEEIEALVLKTNKLAQYKAEPSSAKDLLSIPLLKISDISKDVEPYYNTMDSLLNVPIVRHDLFTNGIGYLNLCFDVTDIPFDLLPYLTILKGVLGYVDTKHYTYSEFSNEIGIHTGGLYQEVNIYRNANVFDQFKIMFEIKGKIFFDKLKKVFELIDEIIFYTKFDDTKRLYEIICEGKANIQASLMRSSDSAAVIRNLSYFSKPGAVSEQLKGISGYKFIEDLEEHFEERKTDLVDKLKKLQKYVFQKERLTIGYTANDEGFVQFKDCAKNLLEKLKKSDSCDFSKLEQKEIIPVKKNEGIKTSAQIQYVTRAGNFRNKGFEYTGALRVLRTILSYEYLWKNVRVSGGAYGCNCMFSKSGESYFSSYRDPNLLKTNEVFDKTPDYVRNFEVDERDMTKYVIGTISALDTPLTPFQKGNRSMSAYFSEEKIENLKKDRMEVLETNQEVIRSLSDITKAVLDENSICVIGNEANIEKDSELFYETVNLFGKDKI